MKNLFFADQLLLRMPANSVNAYDDDIQRHLTNQYFKAAIYIASPLFFACLEQKEFMFADLSDKEKLTLKKYLNRFSFRPTPFGLFAGVSLIRWDNQTNLNVQAIRQEDIVIMPDQTYVLKLSQELRDKELETAGLYEPNPTLYRLLEELRFISSESNDRNQTRNYLLQSVEYSGILKDLVAYCTVPKSSEKIIKEICRLANCTVEIGEDYFQFLTDEQFLVSRFRPNISGPGYLELLLSHAEQTGNCSQRMFKVGRLLTEMKTVKGIEAPYFRQLNGRLNELLVSNPKDSGQNQFNVLLNRRIDSGSLSTDWQGKISDALYALRILCPNETILSMEQFVKTFQKDFEGRSLELLYALDPEVGIGYYVTEPDRDSQLLETLNIAPRKNQDNSGKWTAAHSFLLEKWHEAREHRAAVIRLAEEELAALNPQADDLEFLGFSMLFRTFNEQLYIESLGGINAPALMGRFTIGDQKITNAARKMAQQQEADNPEIIFAEILHLTGSHTDNVNRREVIWSYDLPVTAASSQPADRQLSLADLRIRVEHNKVVLYSEKHQKVVIPRLTSAYNHNIDKLPLFRFLADLSYQYGRNGFSLNLRRFFPGLSYYPRIEYKACILELATWVISEDRIKSLLQSDVTRLMAEFETLAEELKLPPVFSFSEGDQQLVFFRNREQDVLFFAGCIKQKKEVVLKEYLLEKPGNAILSSTNGESFVNQFNAYLIPQKPAPVPPLKTFIPSGDKVKRKYIPGSEWLYLKIYTSKIGSKRLLLKIMPLIRRKYAGGPIRKWFFIRYEDHAPHIRLRMQILPQDISEILIAFKRKLEDGINQHVIREYQVDVYSRELERYQAAGIEPTESFFWASSELALKFLKLSGKGDGLLNYEVALLTVMEMIRTFLPETDAQLQFAADSSLLFFPEFDEKKLRIEMDKKYRELVPGIKRLLSDAGFLQATGLVNVNRRFVQALNSLYRGLATDENGKEDLLRSVIHMHLNRLFTDDARKQEMTVYYLLFKYLLSEKGRNRNKKA
jgi:thiopeptide-type bacteriocin biosynthesis protein